MTAGAARAAVVGVGHSKVYRRDDVMLGLLALDACRDAIADAGLRPEDIDGVASDPVQPFDGAGNIDGINMVRPEWIINALGLDVCWHESVAATISQTIIEASNAVASGNCKAVLAFRALHNPAGRYGVTNVSVASGHGQYLGPYGVYAPAMYAQLWQRYMHEYGTTREQMAAFVVHSRKNGLMWQHGYWYQHRPEPLTKEQYMDARMISSPLSIYDCDIPVQGCGAFVITSAERAKDLPHKPAYLRGWAVPGLVGGSIVTTLDVLRARAIRFGENLFRNARITQSDVDVLNVYDGFSIFVPLALESLGFCKEGEAFDFMTEERIAVDGEFPLNTSGGNLGAGRMHGVPHFMDAVLQVMGRSGPRQVANVEVAMVTAGGPPGGGAGAVFSSFPD